MLSPLYMAEISPPEVRGSLLALEQLSIVLGCVIGFWAGFFTRNGACVARAHVAGCGAEPNVPHVVPGSASWRIPLGVQIGPGVILGAGTLFLPPSPRLLVLQGRIDRARTSLAKLRGRVPDDSLVEVRSFNFHKPLLKG
jgi:MFS family permease